jgi:hypothetical protein
MAVFDALYRGFGHAGRSTGPRPVARPRKRSASNSATSGRRRAR